uniref:Uncharacterized protein n=1 Tax=Odontella aurita TaxID=265563 RepID=A0A7S4IG44_9STRA|mmetsp:Transcript_24731/g.72406  ORF Transcript_24731/g.72406 Transcript_24731/m.72406 type:complete len:1816 (+) Transcript_24731:372-5819(+)
MEAAEHAQIAPVAHQSNGEAPPAPRATSSDEDDAGALVDVDMGSGEGTIGSSVATNKSPAKYEYRKSVRSSLRSSTCVSSLEMRKVPEHILLGQDWESKDMSLSGSGLGMEDTTERAFLDDEDEGKSTRGILQRTCLRPQFSLRTQLVLSFGSVSALTVLFVMIISIVISISAASSIRISSKEKLKQWAQGKASSNAQYVSEAFTPMLPGDVSEILLQVVRDRFVGYPDAEGYESDELVPFRDMVSGKNRYPIDAPPLPLDWQIGKGNVNGSNFREHVGERREWYGPPESTPLSTASAFFSMQGACDPSITDPGHKYYHVNCTDASNKISTGGSVSPSLLSASIYKKGKDLSPILKVLYESTPVIKTIAMLFTNSGAGAGVIFPHSEMDGTEGYESIGCEWMLENNPLMPDEPIGTKEEISRCHPKGEIVSNREYNPLERGWCKDMAQNPWQVRFVGPYLDAWSEHLWLITVGQAVYDKKTKKLTGCILLDISIDRLADELENVKIGESGLLTLVKWDDVGTIVSSPKWDSDAADEVVTVDNPELGTGLSVDDFKHFKDLVNFSAPWNPEDVREKYHEEVLERAGGTKFVSSYPVPPPPGLYNESYRPDFMVLVTLEKSEVFQPFYDLGDAIDEEVRAIITFTIIVGFAGLGGIFCVIFAVSVFLTQPLRWIKETSYKIIDNFGNEGTLDLLESADGGGSHEHAKRGKLAQQSSSLMDKGISATAKVDNGDDDRKTLHNFGLFSLRPRCSPKTELSDLTREFQHMVSHFSADGTAAKAVRLGNKIADVRNGFQLQEQFDDLYERRNEPGFKYDYEGKSTKEGEGRYRDTEETNPRRRSVSFFGPAERVNFGPNILTQDDTRSVSTIALLASNDGPVTKSRLFRWIVGMLVTPLLVVTITISAVVINQVSKQSTSLNDIVEEKYINLEEKAANTAADLRSIHASVVMQKASRDLHLLSRFAGWLLFDGLNRTDSFTKMHTSAEECKMEAERGQCNHILNALCDCAWGDILSEDTCSTEMNDTRYLQELFFEGQRQNASPNGDRKSSPVPFYATSPNKTAWWDNPFTVPGYGNRSLAKGYQTTYDRLRVISASSAIQVPLYNYDNSRDKALATYIGFEADGMLVGHGGCGHSHANYAFFVSSSRNGAADLRDDLCPLGKYGYDARCRDWYDTGKTRASSDGAPLHVTPPYPFGGMDTLVAQSATLPLVDPRNKHLVGMSLLDFMSNAIFSSVTSTRLVDRGFPILITGQTDVFRNDAVIGPNFTLGIDVARVEEVVVPYDWRCANNTCSSGTYFDKIAGEMREGKNGKSSFVRTTSNGDEEKMYISYAPVNVTSYRPLNHSDFSRGVERFSSLVYSLAFVQPKTALLATFANDSENIKDQVKVSIAVLTSVILLASVFLVYISARVTVSITVPILSLLKIMRNINRLENNNDFIIQTDGSGSSEVSAVYETFSMLFKVVRFANAAFFSGDIEKAYWVLFDALRLFRSLDNKKAIGVASNNLGNCMLTMYRTMEGTKETEICGLSKTDIIRKGTAYFRDAIKLGEEAYDKFYEEQGWSGSCLVFMQHLSSRYFNRAIFFLTVKNDHKFPEEANRLGFRDLDIAKSMDVEVVDQSLEAGFNVNKSELFDLMVNRIRGVLSIMEMGYPDEWDIEEQISDAFRELKIALRNPSSEFFADVSPAGHMQELEAELIKHAQLTNMTEEAAMIGIRMLVEDEYTFHYAESIAIKALVDYVTCQGQELCMSLDVKELLLTLQKDMNDDFMDSVSNRISDVQNSEENKLSTLRSSCRLRSATISTSWELSLTAAQCACRGDFTMENF